VKEWTKRALGSLGLIIIGGCGGALLGEGLVRLVMDVPITPQMFANDPATDFRLKPNAHGRVTLPGVVAFSWTTNSRGYRATREFAVPKPASARRILFLGDSFTFGQGVEDHETFAAQTERRLKQLCPTTELEVVNAGVPGFSTSQELALLEAEGLALRPDVVVLAFYGNDPEDNLLRGVHRLIGDTLVRRPAAARPRIYRVKKVVDKVPGYGWLTERSHLLNLMRRAYVRWTSKDAETARISNPGASEPIANRADTTQEESNEAYRWRLMRVLLRRMHDLVQRADSRLLVLLIPEPADLRLMAGPISGDRHRLTALGRMRIMCRELDLACLDLVTWLPTSGREVHQSAMYIPGEFHFTPFGNALTAEFLAPHLRDSLACAQP
jgi:lysophospholipase L1-like esterase